MEGEAGKWVKTECVCSLDWAACLDRREAFSPTFQSALLPDRAGRQARTHQNIRWLKLLSHCCVNFICRGFTAASSLRDFCPVADLFGMECEALPPVEEISQSLLFTSIAAKLDILPFLSCHPVCENKLVFVVSFSHLWICVCVCVWGSSCSKLTALPLPPLPFFSLNSFSSSRSVSDSSGFSASKVSVELDPGLFDLPGVFPPLFLFLQFVPRRDFCYPCRLLPHSFSLFLHKLLGWRLKI